MQAKIETKLLGLTVGYRWKCRASLIVRARIAAADRRLHFTSDSLEEWLTDLSRSGTWIAKEACSAVRVTTDQQWSRLIDDINCDLLFYAE